MNVFINHVSSFLPNAPVSNDDMEAVLGRVNGRKSRARALILRSNGIVNRYYAMERETGSSPTATRSSRRKQFEG